MHNDLLGYLFGSLEPDELQRVEDALARDPRLRIELEHLRRCLRPLETLRMNEDPPPGLVERVWAAVSADGGPGVVLSGNRGAESPSVPVDRSSFHALADSIVLAIVSLAAFTLFLPALANSRYEARKSTCQDNLRRLGSHLMSFSFRQPDQRFPLVPVTGNRSFAGVFAPSLLESRLISRSGSLLVCPGSNMANAPGPHVVPTFQEIDSADRECLGKLQHRAGGSYAYSVGYLVDGQPCARNRGRSHYALMADAPSLHLPLRLSDHHGGRGLNVLYEDGRVLFITDLREARGDNPLRNHDGFAEAAHDPDDAVVLPSGMRPISFDRELILPVDRSP